MFEFSAIGLGFNSWLAWEQPEARLEHAFRVAHEHLGVDRILDPEGKTNKLSKAAMLEFSAVGLGFNSWL